MLRSRYDARADRMLLVVPGSQGEADATFSITRRLWLALSREVWKFGIPRGDEMSEPGAVKTPSSHESSQPWPTPDFLMRVELSAVREGFSLRFTGEHSEATLQLGHTGFRRFRRLLETQADRAGWDLHAAMERMQAHSVAAAAVHRARNE